MIMEKHFAKLLIVLLVFQASHGLIWPCNSNEECTSEESKCSTQGTCECDFDHVFSSDYAKCLKTSLYSDKCEETSQCNLMPSGAKCNKGVCECNDGYTYVRGRCRLLNGIGSPCQTDIDCHFGYDRQSVMCRNNICDCADGYYNRYGNIFRRKSIAINDPCVVNTDCDELGNNVKCENLVCASTSTNGDFPRNQREIAVQTSLESYELKPLSALKRDISLENPASSSNATGRITRDEEDKTLSTLSNTDEEGEEKRYGSSCTENGKPCQGLSHSTCADNVCYCKQGYYARNGKCFAELGEIAESLDECEFELEEATKKCLCQKNYFYERSLRSCRKPIQFHLSCTSNSQCSPFGAVYCHPSIPRRCTCEKFAEYDELRQLCVFKQGLGAECENNESCPVENSICSSEHVCKCKENFIEDKGACAKGIGAECTEDSECVPTNTVCDSTESKSEKSRSCQCRKGYVHFKDECLKQAVEPEDECVETEQCKPLLANCVDKKCVCGDKQHFSSGKCVDQKGLGEACTRAGECHVEKDPETVECRSSICQCKLGYQSSTGQRTCTRAGSKNNSSGRPSALKIITFMLIGSAFLITSAALKQAFY